MCMWTPSATSASRSSYSSPGNVESGCRLLDTFYTISILKPGRTQATLLVQLSKTVAYRRVSRSDESVPGPLSHSHPSSYPELESLGHERCLVHPLRPGSLASQQYPSPRLLRYATIRRPCEHCSYFDRAQTAESANLIDEILKRHDYSRFHAQPTHQYRCHDMQQHPRLFRPSRLPLDQQAHAQGLESPGDFPKERP